jgi:hypothetical protein
MKASDLIWRLQEDLEKYGDHDVLAMDEDVIVYDVDNLVYATDDDEPRSILYLVLHEEQ